MNRTGLFLSPATASPGIRTFLADWSRLPQLGHLASVSAVSELHLGQLRILGHHDLLGKVKVPIVDCQSPIADY